MPGSRPPGFRRIHSQVRIAFFELLQEAGRASNTMHDDLVPGLLPPAGWGEASGASWAGFLKRIEVRLTAEDGFRFCHVTATDGHITWKQPLSLSIYLVAAKTLTAEKAAQNASRSSFNRN